MPIQKFDTPFANAILDAYELGQDDEIIEPIVLIDGNYKPIGRIKPQDGLIFANIRGEREVERTSRAYPGRYPPAAHRSCS